MSPEPIASPNPEQQPKTLSWETAVFHDPTTGRPIVPTELSTAAVPELEQPTTCVVCDEQANQDNAYALCGPHFEDLTALELQFRCPPSDLGRRIKAGDRSEQSVQRDLKWRELLGKYKLQLEQERVDAINEMIASGQFDTLNGTGALLDRIWSEWATLPFLESTQKHARFKHKLFDAVADRIVQSPDASERSALTARAKQVFSSMVARDIDNVITKKFVEKGTGIAPTWDVPDWDREITDGAALLDEVHAKVREFVTAKPEQIDAVTLWTVGTHTYQWGDFAAYLVLMSAEKRSGKTRVQDVIAPMCHRPIVATHMRAETLFRVLEAHHPSVFIDEAHLYVKKSDDHEAVLNGGFQKNKPVWRLVGENHEPKKFDIFAPKCLATIGELQDTIMDRAIVIRMERKRADQTVRPWIYAEGIEVTELRPLRQKLSRWTNDNQEDLAHQTPEIPADLLRNDRAVDYWRGLFAIADTAGGDWPSRARAAAVKLSSEATSSPETTGTELLADLVKIYYPENKPPVDVWPLSNLTFLLNNLSESPWSEINNGKPLTQNKLKTLLRKFGVVSEKRRIGPRSEDRASRGIWRDRLEPLWKAYLRGDTAEVPSPASPVSPPPQVAENIGGKSGILGTLHAVPRTVPKRGLFPDARRAVPTPKHPVTDEGSAA